MDGSSLTKGGGTATDLRIAILDAFEEAGIASPFLRTDVTLRNIDWLRGKAKIAIFGHPPFSGSAQSGATASGTKTSCGETIGLKGCDPVSK